MLLYAKVKRDDPFNLAYVEVQLVTYVDSQFDPTEAMLLPKMHRNHGLN